MMSHFFPGFIAGILACGNYFRVIFSGGRGRNGATVANTSVLFPAFPVAFVQVTISYTRLTLPVDRKRYGQTDGHYLPAFGHRPR